MMRDSIHPDETLREDLDALGASAVELVRRIEVPVKRITEILNGRRAVTGDTALRPERFFASVGRVLAQPSEALRIAERGAQERRSDRPPACIGRRRPAAAFRVRRRRFHERFQGDFGKIHVASRFRRATGRTAPTMTGAGAHP